MKKYLIGSLIGICLVSLLAFAAATYEPKKETAIAEQMEGLYIFTDSKPVLEYEYLGTLKAAIGWSGQYQSVRDHLIKKANKKFPSADALIFHFKQGGTDKCDAIKFKK